MLLLNGVAESVMAQTLPNYVCYLRTPSGEVVNLSAICGTGEEADPAGSVGNLIIRDVQVTDAGVTGVIVNESDQPVRIDGLSYELTQADGQAVLTGSATPATDVLLPNEPVQFSASFSGDDRAQLSEYANVDLQIAIAPNSVTPVEQNDTTTSGEVRNSTTNTNTGDASNNGGLDSGTSSDDGINDVEPGNSLETDDLGGADDADGSDPTDSTFDSDGNTDSSDTFDSTDSIDDSSNQPASSDSTFDSDGNTDANDTSNSTDNTTGDSETLNNGGGSDSDNNQ